MKSAAIRLDSFSAQMTAPDPRQSRSAELEAALHRGYEQGLSEGREASLDALTAALTGLQEQLATGNEALADTRRETITTLAPVLSALVDILAARSCRDRLREVLMSELMRMEETAQPRKLQIKCTADLRPDVELCLAQSGHTDVRIEEINAETPLAELIADKATISFDPRRAVAELQSVIDDIMTED